MLKSELLEILSTIKGDPEIVMWNPFIGDYHTIDDSGLIKENLYKECEEHVKRHLFYEYRREPTSEELEEAMSCRVWEFANRFVPEEEYPEWYGENKRQILILDPSKRGIETFDSLGTWEY